MSPWKGKSEELSVYFAKGFNVIKFKGLNFTPILLIAFLEGSVLSIFYCFSPVLFGESWGTMSKKEKVYAAVTL